jgi:triosephosphate isomerase
MGYTREMQKRKKLIVGNWKMNPATPEEAKSIFKKIKRAASRMQKSQTVICPSDLHFSLLANRATKGGVALGVQDVFWEETGFFTGQVSPLMAKNAGARFVIIGHSERRRLGETNKQVAQKLEASVGAGLITILCLGELQRDREGNFYEVVKTQLLESLGHVRGEIFKKSIVLAYEPVWEIGRTDGKGMKPGEVHEMSIFIRRIINDAFGAEAGQEVSILYGGSVNAENARSIVYDGEVDGLLIGRQSLDAETFSEILKQIELGDGAQ